MVGVPFCAQASGLAPAIADSRLDAAVFAPTNAALTTFLAALNVTQTEFLAADPALLSKVRTFAQNYFVCSVCVGLCADTQNAYAVNVRVAGHASCPTDHSRLNSSQREAGPNKMQSP